MNKKVYIMSFQMQGNFNWKETTNQHKQKTHFSKLKFIRKEALCKPTNQPNCIQVFTLYFF